MPRLLCVIQERTWMQSPATTNQCFWASFIWRNHRGQPIWSPTDDAHPGKTNFVIMLFPLPGKYMKCHISTRLALTYDFYEDFPNKWEILLSSTIKLALQRLTRAVLTLKIDFTQTVIRTNVSLWQFIATSEITLSFSQACAEGAGLLNWKRVRQICDKQMPSLKLISTWITSKELLMWFQAQRTK